MLQKVLCVSHIAIVFRGKRREEVCEEVHEVLNTILHVPTPIINLELRDLKREKQDMIDWESQMVSMCKVSVSASWQRAPETRELGENKGKDGERERRRGKIRFSSAFLPSCLARQSARTALHIHYSQ